MKEIKESVDRCFAVKILVPLDVSLKFERKKPGLFLFPWNTPIDNRQFSSFLHNQISRPHPQLYPLLSQT